MNVIVCARGERLAGGWVLFLHHGGLCWALISSDEAFAGLAALLNSGPGGREAQ